MKNIQLPDNNFYDFIKNHANDDPKALYLSIAGKDLGFPAHFAVVQIESRKKCGRKLASFISHDRFLFPSLQAAEQATHQCVARYHADLIGCGQRVADLTAGLGIDAFTIASAGNSVTAIELDPERAGVLEHNSDILNMDSVSVINEDCIAWLNRHKSLGMNVIFIDPARRAVDNSRTYGFKDCLPDITTCFRQLLEAGDRVFIKASPMLDIHASVKEIPSISEIHIVCIKGECKEVLIIAGGESANSEVPIDDIKLVAVDLDDRPDGSLHMLSRWETVFGKLGNHVPAATLSDIAQGCYLYDPNAAIHKLNSAEALCNDFRELKRLAPNTDLYLSNLLYENFPGRIFRIESLPDKKALKAIKDCKFEVAVRNYPLTAEQLRKKLKVKPGGDRFIFGFGVGKDKKLCLAICSRENARHK